MSSITLHNLDSELERRIRETARKNQTSLNQTIKTILREALHIEKQSSNRYDFSDLANTMTEDEAREFEEANRSFSQIDQELWR